MSTQKAIEALSIRGELALWKGRRSIYGARRKALSSEYVLKKDVVDRMERSVFKHFSLFNGNYEDRLAKEKWEVNEAKKAYEKIVFYIEEGGKRISELEQKAEGLGEERIYFEDMAQKGSSIKEMGADPTAKKLILWCQLVEEGSLLANNISSFLEDFVVYMEHSNNGTVQNSETMLLANSLNEVNEKAKSYFDQLRQDYEKMDMGNKMKHVSMYKIALSSWGTLELVLRENAMLYTIQTKIEELQKRLSETFATMEDDGERLLEKLKRESCDAGNPVTDERDKKEEKSGSEINFPKHTENKYEEQDGIFPSYAADKWHIQQQPIFSDGEFQGKQNLDEEKEALLSGIRLLREDLKSVRGEMQESLKRSRGRFFGRRRKDFNEEQEVPEGIKKLEFALEGWRRELKEFRRKARHFPCALDRFASMESRRIERDFENVDAGTKEIWYLTYLDELETAIKTAENQLLDFSIDF